MMTRKVTTLGLAMLVGGAALTAAVPALASPAFNLCGRMHLDTAIWDEDDVPRGCKKFCV